MMANAGSQFVAGGASPPPALAALPTSRTITNGVLAILGGYRAEAP
jgi:hypothetical protein